MLASPFPACTIKGVYQGGAFRQALMVKWLEACKFDPKNLETIRAHPDYDDFWKALDCERVADRVNVPMMFVGGWYDIFIAGTLNSFTTVNAQGGDGRSREMPTRHGTLRPRPERRPGLPQRRATPPPPTRGPGSISGSSATAKASRTSRPSSTS